MPEEPQWWIFTFGHGQDFFGMYFRLFGTYNATREHMFHIFGAKWSVQYPSEKAAGVARWNLTKLLIQSIQEDTMDFSQALVAIKTGHRVERNGWNGKGMFIFLVPGSHFEVNRAPLLGIYPEGTPIDYPAHLDMKTATGEVVPWVASQTDLLADDWDYADTASTPAPPSDVENNERSPAPST